MKLAHKILILRWIALIYGYFILFITIIPFYIISKIRWLEMSFLQNEELVLTLINIVRWLNSINDKLIAVIFVIGFFIAWCSMMMALIKLLSILPFRAAKVIALLHDYKMYHGSEGRFLWPVSTVVGKLTAAATNEIKLILRS